MKFSVKKNSPGSLNSDCLVLPYFKEAVLAPVTESANKLTSGAISTFLAFEAAKGNVEEVFLFTPSTSKLPTKRILLVGCGDAEALDLRTFKKIILSISKTLSKLSGNEAHLFLEDIQIKDVKAQWHIQKACEWIENQQYDFTRFKTDASTDTQKASPKTPKKTDKKIKRITFAVKQLNPKQTTILNKACRIGLATAQGMAIARNLGNMPPNICHPTYLAAEAKKLAKTSSQLSCTVINEAALKKMGAGAFVSVSQGSKQPGKLIILDYKGSSKKSDSPIVLVGKGITFDTGGISLKPGKGMDEMKYDMCGAASVFGTLKAIIELKLPINVIGAIAAAENMPSGWASRPGDIVTSLSGQTIEILNTDAEGRLVLCDTLTYIKRYKPKAVINMATLTGACIVALGHHQSGLITNTQSLADDLTKASKSSMDWAWQLPLTEEYDKQLESPFADMANIGPGGAGTITAGAFLSRFTKSYKWAHLDIAGTAWTSGGMSKGATGRPVPLLTQYLIDQTTA